MHKNWVPVVNFKSWKETLTLKVQSSNSPDKDDIEKLYLHHFEVSQVTDISKLQGKVDANSEQEESARERALCQLTECF